MTAFDTSPLPKVSGIPSAFVCVVLGIVLIGAGILILGDVVLATVVSTLFIGWTSIAAGAFEIIHSFWVKEWGGRLWQSVLGVLYLAFGTALVAQPVASAIILTYFFGVLLLVSGIVRILHGAGRWSDGGWIMLASGGFGVIAGLVILTGFPATGMWVLGFVLGIDLISHGIAWIAYAWSTANVASAKNMVAP